MKYNNKQIAASRKKALQKVVTLLDAGNPDEAFKNKDGSYYSDEKFIVSWKGNYNGYAVENGLNKVDSFYSAYSGHKSIYTQRSLLHEKQIKGYPSIEYGLIDIGIKLCKGIDQKNEFFKKYAIPYNERIKSLKQ